MKPDFKIFLLTTFLGFVLFLLLSFSSFARVRYIKPSGFASMSLSYVPIGSNNGTFGANLSVGFGGKLFVEYNQNTSLSSSIFAPKLFTVRSGYSFALGNELTLRPFVGLGVMPVTSLDDAHKAKMVYSTGLCLIQDIGKDFYLIYELSINNKYVIPSIGMYVKF